MSFLPQLLGVTCLSDVSNTTWSGIRIPSVVGDDGILVSIWHRSF
ncbi:MAG TPA: hypothetical protein VN704_05540 [Verrucomicrobiae bacterium]|nr:hypothetical protein [Verrucomicrobiae bacterium]